MDMLHQHFISVFNEHINSLEKFFKNILNLKEKSLKNSLKENRFFFLPEIIFFLPEIIFFSQSLV